MSDPLFRNELRRAAVAHMAARREGRQEAQHLAEIAEAAAAAGLSLREIDEIIISSTREERRDDTPMAA